MPGGVQSTVTIEISAFGNEGPWWLLAVNLPNNGRHQFIMPDFGSESVFLKFTLSDGFHNQTMITETPFTILGSPTNFPHQEPKNSCRIFPNPGGDFIMHSGNKNIKLLYLTGIDGKVVISLQNPVFPVDAGNLRKGCYQYKIVFNDGTEISGKWVKIRY